MNAKKHMSEVSMVQRVAAYLAILVGYFFYCYNFVIIDYVLLISLKLMMESVWQIRRNFIHGSPLALLLEP